MISKVDIPMGMRIKEVNHVTGDISFEPLEVSDVKVIPSLTNELNTLKGLMELASHFKQWDTEENGTYFSIIRQSYGVEVSQFSFKFNYFTFNSKEVADKFLSIYKDRFKSCQAF